MKLSTDRILTTIVGSLPRPDDLLDLVIAQESHQKVDPAALEARVRSAVAEVVAKEVESGVDIVSDGEYSKTSYTFYVRHRLSGMGDADPGSNRAMVQQDVEDHPDFGAEMKTQSPLTRGGFPVPACVGPVAYADRKPLETDLANFRAAVDAAKPVEAFMTAASPGVLTKFVPDTYYHDEDKYVAVLADAMKTEYEAIHKAGFLLQIDCPDMASARHNQYRELSDAAFLKIAERNLEAVNHATANIPPEAMRMHICWGNYEGPHTHDVPLATILPLCMKARPAALLFEGANPRHEHEWEDLAAARIPDNKVLIPGVIDSTTNFVEHPRLVAQRIQHYADIVGRERVIAGTDCGFSTVAGRRPQVARSVVWSKLQALAEGARIASQRLWR